MYKAHTELQAAATAFIAAINKYKRDPSVSLSCTERLDSDRDAEAVRQIVSEVESNWQLSVDVAQALRVRLSEAQ